MTRRSVRFAFAALIGTVLVAVVLALAYGNRSLKNLSELGADKNTALALSISNAARVPLQHLLDLPPDLASAELRNSAAAEELQSALDSLTRDLSVVKVKVYNRPGTTVFSTDPDQIGKAAGSNPGFITAMVGGTISEIVRRDTLNPFDQIVERRDLIQTYLPVHSDGGKVIGVFEVYSDITPLLARIASTQRGIVAGVAGILGLFYVLLVWLFWRIDKRLIKEEAATRSYLDEIEATNATLEKRVAERTRALEKSRSFLQTAIDGVPDPALVIDRKYRITSMNKAARQAFDGDGQYGEELNCYHALFGRDNPCDDPDHPCTLLYGEAAKCIQERVDANGNSQQVEIRTTPLRGSDGKVSGAIAVAHDLNEREQITYKLRQAKERAETASQVKSEFVAMMSHEIRTPMNAVLGMTDLLRLTQLSRKQEGYIQVIQGSGNMLLGLVDNILDFTKLGAGALEIRSREFGLNELLERVLEIMGYHAYSKGLELAVTVDADMSLRVLGDKHRLRQILINLVSNAVKYSEQGEIIITAGARTTSDETMDLVFSVIDRGIGMTDEIKHKIFTPFPEIGELDAGHLPGSGLGLTICKQLVEYMGGEIGIDSRRGEGTKVWFTVPVKKATLRGSIQKLRIPALQNQRVLVVCRNVAIAQVICSYTEAWDMSCDYVTDVGVALHRLLVEARDGHAFGLVIIDNSADSMHGLTLARHIRATGDVADVPIILLTPISTQLEPGEISSVGRIRCVNKPVLPSELRLALFQSAGMHAEQDVEGVVETTASADNELRILVAEDNPVNQRVLTGMLNSLNHSADCVDNGPAVLEALENRYYDVVLMDCQMPGMDGEEVTETIRREQRQIREQPIIVAITADASLEHRSACLKAGMDDFIAKPLRLEKLRKGLHRWRALSAARSTPANGNDKESDILVNDKARAQLRNRAGNQGEDFLSDYIDLFLLDTASRLDSLAAAFERDDMDALRRESHTLKGACLEFGVVRMGRYCDQLRDSAAVEKFDQVPNLLQDLRREFDRIRPVFEAEKAGTAS